MTFVNYSLFSIITKNKLDFESTFNCHEIFTEQNNEIETSS